MFEKNTFSGELVSSATVSSFFSIYIIIDTFIFHFRKYLYGLHNFLNSSFFVRLTISNEYECRHLVIIEVFLTLNVLLLTVSLHHISIAFITAHPTPLLIQAKNGKRISLEFFPKVLPMEICESDGIFNADELILSILLLLKGITISLTFIAV